MSLEKSIIKKGNAPTSTFDYKPRDLKTGVSQVARSFVDTDAGVSPDFIISELVSKQAGINQLEADNQRDKINQQVLERLKEVQEKAYQEGYELGLIEGTEKAFQEAKQHFTERLVAIESMLKRMETLKTRLAMDNEAELIRLVFLIAKKISLANLEDDREAVRKILIDVLGEAQTDEKVMVRLSAEDLFFIESLQEKAGQKIESLERVKFIPDETIKPGGCLIETEYGTVDATIDERVERTWQTLQARIPQKPREDK